MPKKVLILGGTTEARLLVSKLLEQGDHDIILSLAGALGDGTEAAFRKRLGSINDDRLSLRLGGFGGIDGLHSYLIKSEINLLVDATHPYAAQMSTNAVAATDRASIPMARYERPAWQSGSEASWIAADDLDHAAKMVPSGGRAFLAVGRQSAAPFAHRNDCTFLLRSVAPADEKTLGKNFFFLRSMPGKNIEEEIQLLQDENITCLVTKNSGAMRSYYKVLAAEKLGLDIIMISRPTLPDSCTFNDLDTIASWIDNQPTAFNNV